MEELRYPIGPYNTVQYLDEEELRICIQRIESFPKTLKNFVASFDTTDWQATYRPGGWSAVQLVHHLADSHLHSYARFRHAVTEETPTIKDYPESLWAELEDAQSIEHIPASLHMITGIHQRWGAFLKNSNPKITIVVFIIPRPKPIIRFTKPWPITAGIVIITWDT